MPRLHSGLIAATFALLGLALLATQPTAGGDRAAAATQPCSAAARAVPERGSQASGKALSVALTLEIVCDTVTDLVLTAPGSATARLRVEPGAPLLVESERAYLCEGQPALVEFAAPALNWAEDVPIAGLRALPRCDLLLKAGVTELHWSEQRARLSEAFAPHALGTDGTAALGLSVWSFEAEAPWSWIAWGDGVPPLLAGLDALATGRSYIVVSEVERAWTFPSPSLPPSQFESAQVVSFYGHPDVAAMGALGKYSPARAAQEIALWAERYDRLNGPRDVIPAFHVIVAVAQPTAQRDGSYLRRLSDERIAEYVEAARAHDMLLFLDVQIGWSDPLAEVRLLEPFLAEPFVHLALDPEFATRRFQDAPGQVIGAIDAAQVNAVQRYLSELVSEGLLPPKILVLHQFLDRMLRDRDAYLDVPEVEITIDMDGFGLERLKLQKYDRFARPPQSERAAIKLFFDWDTPLISPATLQALDHPPDLIIYQ